MLVFNIFKTVIFENSNISMKTKYIFHKLLKFSPNSNFNKISTYMPKKLIRFVLEKLLANLHVFRRAVDRFSP
jgi:hypothetical protein